MINKTEQLKILKQMVDSVPEAFVSCNTRENATTFYFRHSTYPNDLKVEIDINGVHAVCWPGELELHDLPFRLIRLMPDSYKSPGAFEVELRSLAEHICWTLFAAR